MGCDFNPRWFWTGENVKAILALLPELNKPIFHVCSGYSNIGEVRIDKTWMNDLIPDGKFAFPECRGFCNIRGDMEYLPFKDGVAGSVICDPPYKYDFTKKELISELIRICKPKGKIVFIAPWIPNHKAIKVLNTDLWKVGSNGAYHKIRTMFYKANGQIGDYV